MEEHMTLRPMTNVERMYSYTQSEQIMAQPDRSASHVSGTD